jgi:DNA-3-methyladenine glycosylase I
MSYCAFIGTLPAGRRSLHAAYHDQRYGFPVHDDNELFGRLVLEINQAGLSWETILRKEADFRRAYADFNVARVAAFTESDVARLLSDAGIIRNRLKINAAITNAQAIATLQVSHGSFENWLAHHHPLPKTEWVKLFKRTFRFTGGAITSEFLLSIGYLPGAHAPGCPIYEKTLAMLPPRVRSDPSTVSAVAL